MACRISAVYKISSKRKPERVYVGSSVNVRARQCGHFSALRRGDHSSVKLQRHFDKYGEDDLQFSIVRIRGVEVLLKCEQYYLDKLKPYFNSSVTAGNQLGFRHSQESRKRIRRNRVNA